MKLELPQYQNPYLNSMVKTQLSNLDTNKEEVPSVYEKIDKSLQNNNHIERSQFAEQRDTQQSKNSKFDITFLRQKLNAHENLDISESEESS